MSRPKAMLNEIMGSAGTKAKRGNLTLKDLPDVLGDSLPELPKNQVGRFRLVRALKQRFGNNFRTLPGIKNLLSEFDDDIAYEHDVIKMGKIKRS